jgi:hypothetical protein
MKVVRMRVGKNDFGADENEIMDIVIPIRLPPEKIYRDPKTGSSLFSVVGAGAKRSKIG